ncbi:MAG TPA: hypothetical protein VM869_21420 [Enhygromyxa sp.]|nr:hypothetical protein [Enhygromyxa sp.]
MHRFAAHVALLVACGCRAAQPPTPPEPSDAASEPADVSQHRELAMRYAMALALFDRGDYESAAALFTQVLLELPQDPSGDVLRHALIQHVAWSLLGSFDVGGDAAALERGEALLERYLERHESLFPHADGERVVIYELLAEYQLRRDGQPPPDANERLVELVEHTQANFRSTIKARSRAIDDSDVRVIEVDKVPRGRLDDPKVAWFFTGGLLGPSLYDKPGKPLNPTRVLVRGVVSKARPPSERARTYELLRAARPAAERCYEDALGRGADIVERVRLDLTWDATGLADIDVVGASDLDQPATTCVRTALRTAERSLAHTPRRARAQLDLTFFVDFERGGPGKLELDTDRFGPIEDFKPKGVPWVEL